MNKKLLLAVSLSVSLLGCASSPKQSDADDAVTKNDYPTRDRVEYVLNCIAKHGGLSFINQYACGCKIDKISEKLTFDEYEGAKTFSYLKKTPGENGAAFRDPKQSKDLRAELKKADQYAESHCFVMKPAKK